MERCCLPTSPCHDAHDQHHLRPLPPGPGHRRAVEGRPRRPAPTPSAGGAVLSRGAAGRGRRSRRAHRQGVGGHGRHQGRAQGRRPGDSRSPRGRRRQAALPRDRRDHRLPVHRHGTLGGAADGGRRPDDRRPPIGAREPGAGARARPDRDARPADGERRGGRRQDHADHPFPRRAGRHRRGLGGARPVSRTVRRG